MRDPKRIEEMCNEFKNIWAAMPDLSMGQLMSNMLKTFYKKTKQNFFYTEDDVFLNFMKEYLKEYK